VEDEKEKAPEPGQAGFIQKPYVMNDLRKTLSEILG